MHRAPSRGGSATPKDSRGGAVGRCLCMRACSAVVDLVARRRTLHFLTWLASSFFAAMRASSFRWLPLALVACLVLFWWSRAQPPASASQQWENGRVAPSDGVAARLSADSAASAAAVARALADILQANSAILSNLSAVVPLVHATALSVRVLTRASVCAGVVA